MTSSILQTAVRVLMPLLLLFAVFLLMRGHNQPGGGFVGGLVVAASFVLYSIAFGVDAARRALLVGPSTLLGVGLLVAFLSGLPGLVIGQPFMSTLGRILCAVDLEKASERAFDRALSLAVIGHER